MRNKKKTALFSFLSFLFSLFSLLFCFLLSLPLSPSDLSHINVL